jgi:ligand-binding sensor domain-containing protein/DNA-binding CsgD family transcriptional regulator
MHLLKNLRFAVILFSHLWMFSPIHGQQAIPYIENYSKEVYMGGNQNWGVSLDSNHFLYVANNNGLAVYDGMQWKMYYMPNRTIVRSVAVKNDKIYVGSYEEFGYFKYDSKGILQYTSLSKDIPISELMNQEFWEIRFLEDYIFFKSFAKIYKIDKQLNVLTLDGSATMTGSNIINNTLYVGALNIGIYYTKAGDNQFYLLRNSAYFSDKNVILIQEVNNQLFIGTASNGCYWLTDKGVNEWHNPVNELLKKYQLNNMSVLPNGDLVFGTILNGVYVVDAKGTLKYNLNKKTGLQNNTVLSQTFDDSGRLWLGLDNGIDFAGLDSPVTIYTENSGILGTVYAIAQKNGKLFLGSNKGVFYFENDSLNLLPNTQGHVWDINHIQNRLLVSHNRGVFEIQDKKIIEIPNTIGGWKINKIPDRQDYIQGMYNGLTHFETKPDGDLVAKKIKGFENPIKYIAFESSNKIWAIHPYKGVFSLELDTSLDSVIKIKNYAKKGLYSEYKAAVFNLNNRIIFPSAKGWLIYDNLNDTIIPYDNLNKRLNNFKNSTIVYQDNEQIWLDSDNHIIYLDLKNPNAPALQIPDKYFNSRLVKSNVKIVHAEDSKWMITLDDGFGMIDLNKILKTKTDFHKPLITGVKVNDKNIEIKSASKEISYDNNNILFEFTASGKNTDNSFLYRLKNYDTKWAKAKESPVSYKKLPPGNYTFELKVDKEETNTNSSAIVSFSFEVLQPWYWNNWAKLSYLLCLILTLYIVYQYHLFSIRKQQAKLRKKHINEQRKIIRNKKAELDKRLIEIKTEQIEKELSLKNKELANSAMSIIKNKELLKKIKSEIQARKEQFTNQYNYNKLVKLIDKSIESDEENIVFETNFNAVHETFHQKLIHKHPSLTTKDLKLCAFMRMNLSNKEIAPLMNITYRGVEIHRYRLRKKLRLERNEDLTKYLLQY